jgi:hypothetical protein
MPPKLRLTLRCRKFPAHNLDAVEGKLFGLGMKSPPVQYHDDEARERTEAFIAGREVEPQLESLVKADASA